MPACITHNLFAQNVLKEVSQPEGFDPALFLWGAQGPDYLFCHRYLPWMHGRSLMEYGYRLHAVKPSVTLGLMRDFLRENPEPEYRSYVMGFLCHYALDSTAHPYVNAWADAFAAERPPQTRSTMHGEIESALDAIVLRHETGQLPSEVPLGKMYPKDRAALGRMARLYQPLLKKLFQVEATQAELIQAGLDIHLVFSLLTDRTGLKLRIVEALEKGKPHKISCHIVPLTERADVDYANVTHTPWQTPDGGLHEEDFFQLMEQAREKAVRFIGAFDTGDLAALTEEIPFG